MARSVVLCENPSARCKAGAHISFRQVTQPDDPKAYGKRTGLQLDLRPSGATEPSRLMMQCITSLFVVRREMAETPASAQLTMEHEEAKFRLARGRVLLAEQRERVAGMKAMGCSATSSERLLREMELAVRGFENHLRIIEAEVSGALPRSGVH